MRSANITTLQKSNYREALEEEMGSLIPDDVVQTILPRNNSCQKIATFVEKVPKEKKREPQAMEAANRS